MSDFNLRKLDALRELAGAIQCIPGGIASLNMAVASLKMQPCIAVRSVWGLALWYAPRCRDRDLLSSSLAVYRTVSRKPWCLGGVVAPSAAEWLLKVAQKIVKIAEEKSQVSIERIAAERRPLSLVHLQTAAERWTEIRSALAKLRIPPKESLEILRVEAEWEYGQALRRCEKAAPAAVTSRLSITDGMVSLDGTAVPLNATPELREQMLCLIAHLIDAKGNWRSSTDIDEAEKTSPAKAAGVRAGTASAKNFPLRSTP